MTTILKFALNLKPDVLKHSHQLLMYKHYDEKTHKIYHSPQKIYF